MVAVVCQAWMMAATFTAWDGRSYPWPPPDGWYRAPDGRWWAPGSGPQRTADGPVTATRSTEDHDAVPSPSSTDGHDEPSPVETSGRPPAPAHRSSQPGPGSGPADGDSRAHRPDTEELGPLPTAVGRRRWFDSPRRRTRLLAGAAGATILIVAIGFVTLSAGEPGGPSERTTGITASEATTSSSDPAADPSADETTSATATTGINTDRANSTAENASTTTTDTTTATDAPATDDDPADLFRQLLDDADLDDDLLSDRDIEDFGETLCVIAAVEDRPGYQAARTELAADQAALGNLDDAALARVIDAAVIAYCPAEATRLGLDR